MYLILVCNILSCIRLCCYIVTSSSIKTFIIFNSNLVHRVTLLKRFHSPFLLFFNYEKNKINPLDPYEVSLLRIFCSFFHTFSHLFTWVLLFGHLIYYESSHDFPYEMKNVPVPYYYYKHRKLLLFMLCLKVTGLLWWCGIKRKCGSACVINA